MARSRIPSAWIVIGVAGAAVLLSLAAGWYWFPSSNGSSAPGSTTPPTGTTVRVTDVDLIPDYWTTGGGSTTYLTTSYCYPTPHAGCASSPGDLVIPPCPSDLCANVTPGASFSYEVTLVDKASADHQILNITIGLPMTLEGLTPATPYTLAPDTAVTFEITVGTPSSPGSYDLNGQVNTSCRCGAGSAARLAAGS